jgi:hypothetical protein
MKEKEINELSDSNYWNTKKVEELLYKAEEEGLDFKGVDNPFHDGDPELKRANVLWEYTKEEIQEIERCGKDVVYFAQYCRVMTDDGLMHIKLRDYQESVLREYQGNRFNVFLAPRQVGKCFLPTTKITLKNDKKILINDIKKEKSHILFGFFKKLLYKIYNFI